MEVGEVDDKFRFVRGRNGDHLLTPFQCDLCHFRNCNRRDPDPSLYADRLQLITIRRANLDACWSRETTTVARNLTNCRRILAAQRTLGFANVFPPLGPYPVSDTFGMKPACVMLLRSLDPGQNAATVQFSTMRQTRSAFTNQYHASAAWDGLSTVGSDKRKLHLTRCPTQGPWFVKFVQGCHHRMGDEVKQNMALSIGVMLELDKLISIDLLDAQSRHDVNAVFTLTQTGCWVTLSFVGALRGEEMPRADLFGTHRHFEAGARDDLSHVTIALLGRFKGETGLNYHLLPMPARTASGLTPRLWVDRLLRLYTAASITHGPLFRNSQGDRARTSTFEDVVIEKLITIQQQHPHLIPDSVDLTDEFGMSRSFRRGSTTHAKNLGVSDAVIDLNNRWRTFDRSRGSMPSLRMSEYYNDVKLSLPRFLAYASKF